MQQTLRAGGWGRKPARPLGTVHARHPAEAKQATATLLYGVAVTVLSCFRKARDLGAAGKARFVQANQDVTVATGHALGAHVASASVGSPWMLTSNALLAFL